MKKLFLLLLTIISFSSYAQQERLIIFGGSVWFPFDPISGNYRNGSLAQLSGYIDAWKAELDDQNIYVLPSQNFLATMPKGYQTYHFAKDSTLLKDIFTFLHVSDVDTVKFPISKYVTDTLRGQNILVIDRWDFLGDVSYAHKVVNIGDFPVSKRFTQHFDKQHQEIKRYFSTPITTLSTDYSTRDMFFGTSELGNLIHNFQLQYGDISIAAPPQLNLTWQKGDLYIKDIYDMFTYNNDLSVVNASGKLLQEFMENVYNDRFYTYKRPTDDLLRIKTPYFFHDGFAGVDFEVNVSNSKGKRIQNHNIDPTKEYKISISSYRAKWFIEKGCQVTNIAQYRLLFIKWLAQNTPEKLPKVEKWTIVPNININQTIDRELKSIFK